MALTLKVGDTLTYDFRDGSTPLTARSAAMGNTLLARAALSPDARAVSVVGLLPGVTELVAVLETGEQITEPVTVELDAPSALTEEVTPSRETILVQWRPVSADEQITSITARARLFGLTTWTQSVDLAPWASSHLFSGLAADTLYQVEVFSTNATGRGPDDVRRIRTLQFPTAPGAPTASSVDAVGGFRVNFAPQAGDTVTGWRLEWKRRADRWAQATSSDPELLPGASLFHIFTTDAGGELDWRVRAVSPFGESPWTEGTHTLPINTPAAPTLTITRETRPRRQIRATWTKPPGSVAYYEIQPAWHMIDRITSRGGRWGAVMRVDAPNLSVALPGFEDSYQYRIRAVNSHGPGEWSNAAAAPSDNPTTATPRILIRQQYAQANEIAVKTDSFTSDVLFWHRDRDPGFDQGCPVWVNEITRDDRVRVWLRRQGTTNWGDAVDLGLTWFKRPSAHIFTDAQDGASRVAIQPNTRYEFLAQAYNDLGNARQTGGGTVRTAPATPAGVPGTPTVAWLPGGRLWTKGPHVLIQWDMPALTSSQGAVASYQLQFKEVAADPWDPADIITISNPYQQEYLITNRPQPGGPHPFRVRAVNSAGNPGPWATGTFNDDMLFPQPSEMNARSVDDDTVRVAYQDGPVEAFAYNDFSVFVAGSTNFEIYWDSIYAGHETRRSIDFHRIGSFNPSLDYWCCFTLDPTAATENRRLLGDMYLFRPQRTDPPAAPTASVGSVTANAAVLTVRASRAREATGMQWRFDVSTQRDFSSFALPNTGTTNPADSDDSTVDTRIPLTNLSPSTTYYWRVLGRNTNGNSPYTSGQFTTPA